MLCPNCAKPVPPRAVFCPRCGSPQVPEGQPVSAQRDVDDGANGRVPRFRFVMLPPSGMFVIPIIILLVLSMLGFGFCVIPIRL